MKLPPYFGQLKKLNSRLSRRLLAMNKAARRVGRAVRESSILGKPNTTAITAALRPLPGKARAAGKFMAHWLMVRRVVGHSMLPVLPPGTLVIAIIGRGRYKPGQVVIVEHEGKEKIKRIDQIKDNEVFVIGDHADASTDSRQFGWLRMEAVKGRVVWPRVKR